MPAALAMSSKERSRCVIVDIGHDHELIGACFRNERIDARTDRLGEPTIERASMLIACVFSAGDQ